MDNVMSYSACVGRLSVECWCCVFVFNINCEMKNEQEHLFQEALQVSTQSDLVSSTPSESLPPCFS